MTRIQTDFSRFEPLTDEQEQAVQDRLSLIEQRQADAHAAKCEQALYGDLGRYRGFRLDDYKVYFGPVQQEIVDRLRGMANRCDELIDRKLNVIWWGTIGTGKDLMATWLLRVAASRGHSVRWLSARDYYDECSAAFSVGSTQAQVYKRWSLPTVLCLSDPVYEDGWNAKNSEYLNRIIRKRYDAGKATWTTCNVRDVSHARDLFGLDVWDRLKILSC